MPRRLSVILTAAISWVALAMPIGAAADILWDMRAAPVQVGPTDHIRVGTLSGPWPMVMNYLGRPAVASAGWYLEYRTAASAPDGWSTPAIGIDDAGIPAAVRSPVPPQPPESGGSALSEAMAVLISRIRVERQARIAAATGTTEEQLWLISRAMQVQAAIAAGTATEPERAELADLLVRARYVDEVRRYGWTPEVPPMWGAASASSALYAWAEATLTDPAAVIAVDAASPPVEAPQWPARP